MQGRCIHSTLLTMRLGLDAWMFHVLDPLRAVKPVFRQNEWMKSPERSFGSNQVLFGGMICSASEMAMS